MKKHVFSATVALVTLSACSVSEPQLEAETTHTNLGCFGTKYTSDGSACYQLSRYTAGNGECLWRIDHTVNMSACVSNPYPYPGHGPGSDGHYCSGFEYRYESGSCRRYESRYNHSNGRCYFAFDTSVDDANCGRFPEPVEPPTTGPVTTPHPIPVPTADPSRTPFPSPEVVTVELAQDSLFSLDAERIAPDRACKVTKGTTLKIKIFYGAGEFQRVKLYSDLANCAIGKSGTSGFLPRAHVKML